MKTLLTLSVILGFSSSAFAARIVTDRLAVDPVTGEVNRDTIEDGPYGGNGGSIFTDGGDIHTNGPITEIEVHTGSRVDAIKTKLVHSE